MSKKLKPPRNNNTDVKDAISNLNTSFSSLSAEEKQRVENLSVTIPSAPLGINIGVTTTSIPLEKTSHSNELKDKSIGELDSRYEEVFIHELYSAPDEWNLWNKHDTQKKIELMESISEIGVQQNLVLWEIPNDCNDENLKYMILAGHNRVDALMRLHTITSDSKFSKAMALIYKSNDSQIEEQVARRIIDDTNLISRDKTAKEIAMAYVRRVSSLKNTETFKGVSERKIHEFIAKTEGTSRSKIFEYIKLKDLIDPLADLVGNELNIKTGVKLASLRPDIQEFIYSEYYLNDQNRPLFTNQKLSKLNSFMTKETIIDTLIDKQLKTTTLTYEVDERIAQELDKFIKKFIETNKRR